MLRKSGQRITCFDSCQLTITWMPKIRALAMVMLLLSYFSTNWRTDGHTYGQYRDNQNFLDRWVTKFSKVKLSE